MNFSSSEPANANAFLCGGAHREPATPKAPGAALHIVDGHPSSRAEQARTAYALGYHAEVYENLEELFDRPPTSGVLLVRQVALEPNVSDLLDRLGKHGLWLPVIVCAAELQVESVVAAIKQGALDYLQLPLEHNRLACAVRSVLAEARTQAAARGRLNHARDLVAGLSKREREVLELLSDGSSNKDIGRELEISPRTVEIHRGNMMAKMRAGHIAEAVRLWLESGLARTVQPLPCPGVAGRPERFAEGLKAAA